MKVGLSLCPEVGRWSDTVAQARLATELGYDSVWLPEHHLMEAYSPSPMLGLAGLVELTGDLLLGTDIVVAPFHHPVRIAEEAAQLQDMSGGRFVLGLGLGYRPEEFAAFGVAFDDRASIFEEQLEVVGALLKSTGVSFAGRHYLLDDVTIYPRPAPAPPIWVGGWVPRAVRRAARLADAWFPGPTATVAKVAACLDTYDAELAALGDERDELPIFREVWVADNDADLSHGVERLEAMYSDDYVSWGHRNVQGAAEVRDDRFIVGDPEAVAQGIARLRDELGATHLVARLHGHGVRQDHVERAMRLLAGPVRDQLGVKSS
ncbi:MAG: LLM class flavin-dependent oxidoreductase [Acidimicrobiales bacterium]